MAVNNIIIEADNIHKSFFTGVVEVKILKGISLKIQKKSFTVIFGPSGCGKSTLLHVLLGLEKPSSGKVVFLGQDLYSNTDEDFRSEFRKIHIGMVYQQPNWIKSLTVVENVAFPLLLRGVGKYESLKKAAEVIKTLGMTDWLDYVPTELSSGQQQKIALARALVSDPEVIIADEPTGNLDFESGQELMKLLVRLNTKGKTIVMVTHDLEYLVYAKSTIEMLDGKITGIYSEKDKLKLLRSLRKKRGAVFTKTESYKEKKVISSDEKKV